MNVQARYVQPETITVSASNRVKKYSQGSREGSPCSKQQPEVTSQWFALQYSIFAPAFNLVFGVFFLKNQ